MFNCPRCGNTLKFYTKERYKGECNYYFRTDGQVCSENSEMYDYAEHSYKSKFVFCSECHAKVCTVEEMG